MTQILSVNYRLTAFDTLLKFSDTECIPWRIQLSLAWKSVNTANITKNLVVSVPFLM